jgi:chemotaxis protein MotB
MEVFPMNRRLLPVLALAPLLGLGCGHSEDEWQAQLQKYNQVVGERDAKDKELAAAKAHVADLEAQLSRMGAQTAKLELSLEEQHRALEAYKARARQLEAIKARFELLRRKLDELTRMGLAVHIHRNRMVISLPGDVLFDTGKDTLRKEGTEILGKVATVIRNDPSLVNRDYQVAGHTDSAPLSGGPYHDNWGLSVMRARSVIVFLVGGKASILPKQHWSAAGFGDTDPVASNATKDGQQKNRRCDIIVVPSAEEMLDLSALAHH